MKQRKQKGRDEKRNEFIETRTQQTSQNISAHHSFFDNGNHGEKQPA